MDIWEIVKNMQGGPVYLSLIFPGGDILTRVQYQNQENDMGKIHRTYSGFISLCVCVYVQFYHMYRFL